MKSGTLKKVFFFISINIVWKNILSRTQQEVPAKFKINSLKVGKADSSETNRTKGKIDKVEWRYSFHK